MERFKWHDYNPLKIRKLIWIIRRTAKKRVIMASVTKHLD
jgi:hypothetical protein